MAEKINTDDFVKALAKSAGFSQGDVKLILDHAVALLEECVRKGISVNVGGLGKLHYTIVASYKGYDPIHDCEIDVPASTKVNFKLAENIRFAHKESNE